MCIFFFFNDTATTEIYSLSLHAALPISIALGGLAMAAGLVLPIVVGGLPALFLCPATTIGSTRPDRKSTRLNSSQTGNSYAVFCFKKKKKTKTARARCTIRAYLLAQQRA